MFSLRPLFLVVAFVLLSLACSVRSFAGNVDRSVEYRNGLGCPQVSRNDMLLACDPLLVHVAMTIDFKYLGGSVAALHSLLKHSSCPENIFFHFVAANSSSDLAPIVRSSFPSLRFKLYAFQENLVNNFISSSIHHGLGNPLDYARSYLAHMLEPCINRVIYLDSDSVVLDDIHKLWSISITGSREYCHVNFTNYFVWEKMQKIFD